MTDAQALAVIWVLTMFVLGLVWQRMKFWKAAHEHHHNALAFAFRLIDTMEHTEASSRLLHDAHQRVLEGVKQNDAATH